MVKYSRPMSVGGSSEEINTVTEADSCDMIECPRDDQTLIGTFCRCSMFY